MKINGEHQSTRQPIIHEQRDYLSTGIDLLKKILAVCIIVKDIIRLLLW